MLNLTTSEMISLGIWIAAMIAAIVWAHTFRHHRRNIIGNRKIYYCMSAVAVLAGLYGIFIKGINYGLDFTGGTVIEVGSTQKVTADSSAITQMIRKDNPNFDILVQLSADMEKTEEGTEYQKILIRVKDNQGEVQLTPEQSASVRKSVENGLNAGKLLELSETSIGPTISGELKRGAVMALLVTMIFQLGYITFRFGSQLRFGVAAVIALLHDSIIMIGFYTLAGLAVDSSFVAALLTIAGYSVMDSIVIFDRVREHMHRDDKPFEELCNDAVNDTMTRSVNTTLTTLVVCVALYYFGGVTLKAFAYALLVGVTAGAYSSIFLAAPLLCELDILAKKRDANRREELRLAAEERAREDNEAEAAGRPRSTRTAPKKAAAPKVREREYENDEDEEAEREAKSASAPAPRASSRPRRRVKGVRRG